MPLFEYTCDGCQASLELLIRGDDEPRCPQCGSARLTKQLSVPALPITSRVGRRPANSACDPSLPPCGLGCCRLPD